MNELKIVSKLFIPVETKMCHGSTILKLKDRIIVAWFGGTHEGEKDTKIYLSKCENNIWSRPKVIAESDEAHWNPVLFEKDNGEIVLFYKVGNEIKNWRTYFLISSDGGENFSESKELVKNDLGGRGPVRNKPIKISNGNIIFPASKEGEIWSSFVDISDSNITAFEKSNDIFISELNSLEEVPIDSTIQVSPQSFIGKGVIQPTLWESNEEELSMLLRSTEGFIYRSDSKDFGKTWCSAYKTQLPNNNSGIDLVKINDCIVLCYNPVVKNWGERTPLSLGISKDNGKTWEKIIDLEKDKGEYSYPAIIFSQDKIYISYTWNREKIAVVTIEIKKLKEEK